jgi:hypothetical protein
MRVHIDVGHRPEVPFEGRGRGCSGRSSGPATVSAKFGEPFRVGVATRADDRFREALGAGAVGHLLLTDFLAKVDAER